MQTLQARKALVPLCARQAAAHLIQAAPVLHQQTHPACMLGKVLRLLLLCRPLKRQAAAPAVPPDADEPGDGGFLRESVPDRPQQQHISGRAA